MPVNTLQYTIRGVPRNVDQALRRRARETAKSFNQVALEALASGAGEPLRPTRDLSGVVGSLTAQEASALDGEIRRQRRVDPDLWRR
jgi:hypothetical protein